MTDSLTLSDFYAAWELYATPALTGAIVGLVLGVLGVWVVLRRLVFLSAAVGQAASLGVALTFFLGGSAPTLGAVGTSFFATLLVAGGRRRSPAWRDAVLGGVFLVGAAGTLALGSRIVQELSDIDTLLFGSAVAVLPEDFELVSVSFAAILLVHLWWWRGFAAVSFDPAGARVRGLPVRTLEVLLLLTLALAISIGTRVVGALPVFALSVLPAVAGARLAVNVPSALLASALIGALVGFYGYVLAFIHELPVGASQTLVAAGFVLLAEAARLSARLRSRRLEARDGQRWGAALQRRLWPWLFAAALAVLLGPIHGEPVVGYVVAGAAALSALPWALTSPSLVVGLAWLGAALAAPLDTALLEPVVLAFGVAAVALAHRERGRVALVD